MSHSPLVTAPGLVLTRIAAALDWPDICRLRQCSRRSRAAFGDAVPAIEAYCHLAALLEAEASNLESSFEWDILDGIVAGRLLDLPKGWAGHFRLSQSNSGYSDDSETVGCTIFSVPLAQAQQYVKISGFSHSGFISRYYGMFEEDEVIAEVCDKLPPTVICRLYKHAAEKPEIQHCLAEFAQLLGVPLQTVIKWLQVLSDDLAEYLSEGSHDDAKAVSLGSLEHLDARWSALFQYRSAVEKIEDGGIVAALARLDRAAPRCSPFQRLRKQVARLHAKRRMIGVGALYRAICTTNADSLAEEPAPGFDFEAWVTSSVVFTQCQPYDRLIGIEYGMHCGHPFSGEFLLTKRCHSAASWESPKFRISVSDSSAYESDSQHEFHLATSLSNERKGRYHSDREICAIGITEDQALSECVSTLSEKTMGIDIHKQTSLWR
ncbi:hypothetical protein HDU87_002754 [Geranomyces variabilis]|uniref:F-box domain-containing protein n=1 Tax=Geranomyces variabilis TaxID=109894 RepID=A0AAD5TRU0_9FUNG|nr:hypothetical protein HDU87_002754 [Geranomyces variabilis]